MTGTATGARKRTRYGKVPEQRFEIIAEHDGWTLYETLDDDAKHLATWINCKLAYLPGRAGKANYWFGWNVPESRFGRVRDVAILLANDPEIYAWLLSVLDPDTYSGMA